MEVILDRRNRRLKRDIRLLQEMLRMAPVPRELAPYRNRVQEIYHDLVTDIDRNLAYLAKNQAAILPDLLSATAEDWAGSSPIGCSSRSARRADCPG